MWIELHHRFARLHPAARWCGLILAALPSGALAAAAIAATTLGSDYVTETVGDPWIGGGLFALATTVTAVLGKMVHKRYEDWERSRLPGVQEFFQNQDLAKLVGQSLGMILRAETDWPALARTPRARLWLQGIQDRQLVDFVRNPERSALSDGQAGVLLEILGADGPHRFLEPDNGQLVREKLSRRFSEALRQALKRDFARRGEAAYGMLLDVAGELLAIGAAQAPRTPDNAEAVAAARRTLRESEATAPELRVRAVALAHRLDGVYQAV